mmetsp:Transcript_1635/g.5665  ORF Transcript_1635/g.5665 Transcript_1635/m.5665 type:complete len:334 (+) Transcript_1635:1505-2506(+)
MSATGFCTSGTSCSLISCLIDVHMVLICSTACSPTTGRSTMIAAMSSICLSRSFSSIFFVTPISSIRSFCCLSNSFENLFSRASIASSSTSILSSVVSALMMPLPSLGNTLTMSGSRCLMKSVVALSTTIFLIFSWSMFAAFAGSFITSAWTCSCTWAWNASSAPGACACCTISCTSFIPACSCSMSPLYLPASTLSWSAFSMMMVLYLSMISWISFFFFGICFSTFFFTSIAFSLYALSWPIAPAAPAAPAPPTAAPAAEPMSMPPAASSPAAPVSFSSLRRKGPAPSTSGSNGSMPPGSSCMPSSSGALWPRRSCADAAGVAAAGVAAPSS